MRKAENGVVYTDPRITEHETRAVAATAPPDDIDDGDDGARAKPRFATDFLESDVDDGFLKWNLWLRDNLLDERGFILGVVDRLITQTLEQRDAQIRTLEFKLAELRGALSTRATDDEDERRATAIEKLEARNSQMQDLVSKLQAEVAELRGQVGQIERREKGEKGERGERGPKGATGPQGPKGDSGMSPRAVAVKRWQIDKQRYLAIPIMSDNTLGPSIELRGLFEQFNEETAPYGHRPE
jgi:hypothetical protein